MSSISSFLHIDEQVYSFGAHIGPLQENLPSQGLFARSHQGNPAGDYPVYGLSRMTPDRIEDLANKVERLRVEAVAASERADEMVRDTVIKARRINWLVDKVETVMKPELSRTVEHATRISKSGGKEDQELASLTREGLKMRKEARSKVKNILEKDLEEDDDSRISEGWEQEKGNNEMSPDERLLQILRGEKSQEQFLANDAAKFLTIR